MSDVTVAPTASPPPTNEVVVNPNPTSMPPPVGQQAPDRPVEDRPPSRREALDKAFAKARENAKPREAKMGDNNPPETMERERQPAPTKKPKDAPPPPIDLKKRPSDQPAAQSAPRERAEHGHFAPRATDQRTENGSQISRSPVKRLPVSAPYAEAPGRMGEHAKNEWHATPESVRGEVHRMHHEFSNAYNKFRGDHEEMNRVRPFHELAQKHGTTLQKALTNYVNMETKLRNDVVGGLDMIINNLNLRTPDGRQLGLQDVAWHIVNQTPEQRQLLQSKNTMMAQTHQLQAAQQRIATLEKLAQQAQYEKQFVHTRGAVDQYAAQHPRLDELGDLIEAEVKLGFDLDTAYRRAELLRPATHAAQTRNGTHAAQTRTHTAQTRSADRSISGAPASNGDARSSKPVGRREAIANAIRRVNGSL